MCFEFNQLKTRNAKLKTYLKTRQAYRIATVSLLMFIKNKAILPQSPQVFRKTTHAIRFHGGYQFISFRQCIELTNEQTIDH